ncbi:proline aminopeptidase P II [Serratia marcescens]|uniref:Proline aminopeptidase P II n=1 Tax=Serratia marcescens TaxID=615 RepID=A0A379YLY5_SERMA|nr:proline aminopeptidase P II [Serratia marcescens]
MTQQEFNNRRQALLAKMAPASAAVIFSAPGNDAQCRFRLSLPAEQRLFGT